MLGFIRDTTQAGLFIHLSLLENKFLRMPPPPPPPQLVAPAKACVCGHSLAAIAGSNSNGGMDLSLL